ncbi:type II secretion system F family protein [Hyphomonas sp.]|uniref:type II secretion system F family protein n=1 Tax=Hyphomonas sp. TaxID=87 RepID=UPI001DB55963|nr:type II secretion system F family protein [Hyphomonas sp.]MBU3922169.1 type II secretion system F family protein [Alphaproteobacteria bacterium]MBU4060435.1 type II secretion system F family protein [Alphaproteobacteria bacterium]MBU4163103.1 type II secretion system F family protein [Alphaproteobacteria bacterium]
MTIFSGSMVPAALFFLAVLAAIPGIVSFMRNRQADEDVNRRLSRRDKESPGEPRRTESRIGRAVMGFADNAAPAEGAEVSAVRAKLNLAGFPQKNAVSRYFAARLVCVVIPQVALLFSLPYLAGYPKYAPVGLSILLVLLGLSAPGMYLDSKIKQRKQAGSLGFPDMMDLMVACVEAGLSLDAAVQRVGEELELRHPVIAVHLRTLSLELRAGRARKTAWRAFADRMGIEEAGSLATMLRQAEEMGTSLGQTLRVFSADMRQRRILYAEEKAMALPAKLTLPLIFFVFPVLLGVLTLPAVVMLGKVLPSQPG